MITEHHVVPAGTHERRDHVQRTPEARLLPDQGAVGHDPPRTCCHQWARTGRDTHKGDYKFVDEFPISDGLDEDVEFFDLTQEDPLAIELGRDFEAIAPLLCLKAGAVGPRIERTDPAGWSLPDDASYGILFDIREHENFLSALRARINSPISITHAYIVTNSPKEYHLVAGRPDPSLTVSRLYADFLRSFEINRMRQARRQTEPLVSTSEACDPVHDPSDTAGYAGTRRIRWPW